jgi:hypothetical protein
MKRLHLVVISALILSGACAAVRTATSPPDFRQLELEDIHNAMHIMAGHVRDLDEALRDTALPEDERQKRVLAALDGIDQAATDLRPPGATLSHPMLEEKLPQFIRDVEGARAAAATTPPQYFLAAAWPARAWPATAASDPAGQRGFFRSLSFTPGFV